MLCVEGEVDDFLATWDNDRKPFPTVTAFEK
jgi:hypothetical protein